MYAKTTKGGNDIVRLEDNKHVAVFFPFPTAGSLAHF
jgi:hypothetical protein